MFFVLSKIIGAILAPLNLVFLLLTGGFVLMWLKQKAARSCFIAAFTIMIVGGLFPIGENGLAYLENYYERPAEMPERVDGILVLGGSSVTTVGGSRGAIALNEAAERVIEAMALGRKYPEAILVFSGGNGHLTQHDYTEAQGVELLMQDLDYPTDNVILEDESRNTFENIRFSKKLVWPHPEETWLLVTSASHMPRAMGVAQRENWGNIIAYPVDYRTRKEMHWLPYNFDLAGQLYDTQVAMHEFIGIAAYQLTGKISLPLR